MVPSQRYCTRCGAANQAQDAFCFACGHPLQATPASPHYPTAGSATSTTTGLLTPNLLLKQRYRILEPIGKGGFGAVYKTEDVQLGNRLLAVKELSQSGLSPQEIAEATENFKREALLLAALKHPNLPSIYEQFSEAGRWYLVMDYIEGETLEAYLAQAKGGKLLIEETLQIGVQLCTVLDYLHTRKPPIIFRDLKPANIMRTVDGNLFLIDFGIARHFKPGQKRDTVAFGSPGYAAPEQYGKAQTTARSDIYSLGATLHHLLTGIDPSDTPFHFAPFQLPGQPTPPGLEPLLMQMVDMNESNRPTSMIEVKQELQRIILQQPVGQVNSTQSNTLPQPSVQIGSSLAQAQTSPPGSPLQIGRGRNQFMPATVDQLAEHVRAQRSHTAFFPFVLSALIVLNFLLLVVLPHFLPLVVLLIVLLLTIPASIYMAHFIRHYDQKKTHVALNYRLGAKERKNYQRLCSGLEALAKVHRLQQVTALQAQRNWKQHAGASQSASFQPVRLLPRHSISWLKTNIPVWALQRNRLLVVFLPDCILVEKGKKVSAMNYQDLVISSNYSEFMEAGVPPADARILRYAWHYINKNGTPDLRYRNNYQVPVTEATYVNLQSNRGLKLSLQASNRKNAEFFLDCLRAYKPSPPVQQAPPAQQVPQIHMRGYGSPLHETKGKRVFKYPRGQNPFDSKKLDIY
jgi:serine/threonine protein kinase